MAKMTRRKFMSLAATTAATLSISGCRRDYRQPGLLVPQRPNIILILTSGFRADSMSFAGNMVVRTPSLDMLAGEGMYFKNTFVTTSNDCAGMASILTGQWARRHQINHKTLNFSADALARTFPTLLRDTGYRTSFIGKYGIGIESPMPEDKFSYWKGYNENQLYEQEVQGQYKHLTQLTADQAIAFLRTYAEHEPFCLTLSFKAPQIQDRGTIGYVYDRIYKDLYDNIVVRQPDTMGKIYFDNLPDCIKQTQSRKLWTQLFSSDKLYQESVLGYYRLVTGVDVALRRIREQLTRLGIAKNTIIIFTSTNGSYLGEHGLAGMDYPYEVSIKVPLIIYDPRAPRRLRDRQINEFVLDVDIPVTILELASVPAEHSMQGKSLVSLMRDKKMPWRDDFYYEDTNFDPKTDIFRCSVVRTKRFKYVRYTDCAEQLFDLKDDPHEAINLINEKRYSKDIVTLSKRCDALADKVM